MFKIKASFVHCFVLILTACATTPHYSERSSQFITDHFPEEISFIKTMQDPLFKKDLENLLTNVHDINISEVNCSTGQIACSFKSYPHTVFLKQEYFLLSKEEQFTTILHESYHLFHKNFDHVLCAKEKKWGHECDEDFNSAYGIEYKYLLYKYQTNPNNNTLLLLKRLDRRINKS